MIVFTISALFPQKNETGFMQVDNYLGDLNDPKHMMFCSSFGLLLLLFQYNYSKTVFQTFSNSHFNIYSNVLKPLTLSIFVKPELRHSNQSSFRCQSEISDANTQIYPDSITYTFPEQIKSERKTDLCEWKSFHSEDWGK